MESPNVLVVMPLFNARPFVRAALDSIVAQTYRYFILLVINDGSTDGSDQELATFQDERLIVWSQQNQGPGMCMNLALQYAIDRQIPYLARMDADDISLPNRLEKQIHLLEKHPAAAACSVNCHYIDAEKETIIGTSTVSASPTLVHWEINHGLRGMVQGACCFRTSALAEIGGYRPQFVRAEEVDLFLRLADQYELRNCRQFLYNIRIRPNSYSLQNVHQNILFQFYALDCAKKRHANEVEQSFESFLKNMDMLTVLKIWREESVLKLWRSQMKGKNVFTLIFASSLDPRRALIRCLRYFKDQSHGE